MTNKEQAFQNWWSAWLGDSTFGMERYREAFEAGYKARRAEEPHQKSKEELWDEDDRMAQIAVDWDYMNPHGVYGNHRHRDHQDETGSCLDCGESHSHTDPPLPYEATP